MDLIVHLLLLLLCVSPAVIAVYAMKRYRLLCCFSIFILFYLLTYCFRGASLLFGWDEPRRTELIYEDLTSIVITAMLIGFAAHLAAVIGYLFVPYNKKLPLPSALDAAQLSRVWGVFVLVCVLLGNLLIILPAWFEAGSVASLMYRVREGKDILESSYAVLAVPEWSLYVGLVAYLLSRSPNLRVVRFFSLALMVLTAFWLLALGERAELFFPLLALLLVLHAERYSLGQKKGLSYGRLALIGVIMVISSSLIVQVRGAILQAGSQGEGAIAASLYALQNKQSSLPRDIAKSMNLQTFDHLAILTQDFGHSGELAGLHFIRGLQGVIPRSLWQDKPVAINSGAWFRQYYYGNSTVVTGMPFGPAGEWWLNFGLVGMLLGFVFIGVLFRILDNTLFSQDVSTSHRFLIAYFAVAIVPKGLGAIFVVTVLKNFVPLIIVLFMLMGFVSKGRRLS